MCSVVVNYTVIVKTGTDQFAATDADVYMTIYGSLGNTAAILLAKSSTNPFESGNSDRFLITTFDIGESNLTLQC